MMTKIFFSHFVPAYGCPTLLLYHQMCGVGSAHGVAVLRQSYVPTCLKIAIFLSDY
ncbi:MAG: hypothetical protein ACTTI8_06050 [Prevotella intermedia]|uniref:hypothetical protein n=1 Tax=Prevotella intermedia TaxID=28131 RepID=UPI001554E521|nr:hypothetical protein [Prevotella intermedia]